MGQHCLRWLPGLARTVMQCYDKLPGILLDEAGRQWRSLEMLSLGQE
jgi:hypothetical protein